MLRLLNLPNNILFRTYGNWNNVTNIALICASEFSLCNVKITHNKTSRFLFTPSDKSHYFEIMRYFDMSGIPVKICFSGLLCWVSQSHHTTLITDKSS